MRSQTSCGLNADITVFKNKEENISPSKQRSIKVRNVGAIPNHGSQIQNTGCSKLERLEPHICSSKLFVANFS